MRAADAPTRVGTSRPEMPITAYGRIARLIAEQRCVVLDGATGTELIEVAGVRPEAHERLWGAREIVSAPGAVAAVHAAHVRAGCDVVSTNTWGLPTALRRDDAAGLDAGSPVHWMDVARSAVRLARSAAEEEGRGGEVAVAFSLNGDIDSGDSAETIRLLRRALQDEPPDLVLVETLSLVRDSLDRVIDALMDTGLPIWLSFRRCRHGVCGVYGEHWGGPEGDAFGRAARRFEQMGVDALLVNCIPPDHVPGMVSWLRDFTDMPLGVYPNLGYLSDAGWSHDHGIDPEEFAGLALSWREEGAQIIGGCCGVSPEHIAAASAALTGTRPGTARPAISSLDGPEPVGGEPAAPWTDATERAVFPLPFPDLIVDPGVFRPDQASLMLWKHLMQNGVGGYQRCLDVGAGCGIQAVQLLRNGASHVHAIDVDPRAVRSTLANGFRNQVDERLSAATVDLFPWGPPERYDVVVASLDQAPVDPFERLVSHRPLDYWGRNLIDHLVGLLPTLLADDGVAYLTQLSILGQQRTTQQLCALGLACRVVDFAFEHAAAVAGVSAEQIERVEDRSDAYHLDLGGEPLVVAYLLEVTRIPTESQPS